MTRAEWLESYAAERAAERERRAQEAATTELRPMAKDLCEAMDSLRRLAANHGVDLDRLAHAPDAPDPEAQREQARARREARLVAAGAVDADAARLALDSPGRCPRPSSGDPTAAVEVEGFVRDASARLLLLRGSPGRGKSWAATWALAEIGGVLVPATTAIEPTPAWDALRERAIRAPFVVVDDLGREQAREWHSAAIGALIEGRHNAGRKTLVTTNLPVRLEDVKAAKRAEWAGRTIADRYGDRLLSRLTPQRFGRVVACLGPAIGDGT